MILVDTTVRFDSFAGRDSHGTRRLICCTEDGHDPATRGLVAIEVLRGIGSDKLSRTGPYTDRIGVAVAIV